MITKTKKTDENIRTIGKVCTAAYLVAVATYFVWGMTHLSQVWGA